MSNADRPVRVAWTVGDPNGIGPEITIRVLTDVACLPEHPVSFEIVAPESVLSYWCRHLGLSVDLSDPPTTLGHHTIRLRAIDDEYDPHPGEISSDAGRISGRQIESAVASTTDGVEAIVTMPISKEALQSGGYQYPGHTEMLGDLASSAPTMIMSSPAIRVALLTGHRSLSSVAGAIDGESILHAVSRFSDALERDFGIPTPRIAVLGLNPHAGDGGALGEEEGAIYRPALIAARGSGIDVDGPFPADAFFARRRYKSFDGVIASYHDQGLIPMKMLAGTHGVNVTAGLPFVRTSPDHGTAFDRAGRLPVDISSSVEALRVAVEIALRRRGAIDQGE